MIILAIHSWQMKTRSKWGEILTTEKPLVRIRRRKKAFEKIMDHEHKDHIQDQDRVQSNEANLEEIKNTMISSLGQTSDLVLEELKIAQTDGMLIYLESMIATDLLTETFANKKTFQTKEPFNLATREGLAEFVSKSLAVQPFNLRKRSMGQSTRC